MQHTVSPAIVLELIPEGKDVNLEHINGLLVFKHELWSPKAPLSLCVHTALSMLIILALCSVTTVRDKINNEQTG